MDDWEFILLKFFGRSAKNQKPKVAVIELDSNIFMLAESVSPSRWLLSYFMIGKFGNYLIGLPNHWDSFDQLFRKHGGIAYLLPTHRLLDHEAMGRLFSLFGLQTISPAKMKFDFPQVATCQLFSSLKVTAVESNGLAIKWFGRFNKVSFATGQSNEPDRDVDINFPRFYQGEISKFKEDILDPAAQEFVEPINLTAKLDRHFKEDRLVTWHIPDTNIIACYDDLDYDRNDADFLGPMPRRDLAKSLASAGAKMTSGNVWSWDSIVVNFTRVGKTLASEPLDGVKIDPYSIWIMTATEAAFFLMDHLSGDTDQLNRHLLMLADKLPYNLAKVDVRMRAQEDKVSASRLIADLMREIEPTIEHFRRFRVKGLTGSRMQPHENQH